MERCPYCDKKVNTEDKSGFFGATKNKYLPKDKIQEINSLLPDDLKSEQLCNECTNPYDIRDGGLLKRIRYWKSLLKGRIETIQKEKQEAFKRLSKEGEKFFRYYSITPKDFEPKQLVEAVIMFDSGTRSTSSDNFNAGVWNVINDSIALQLGNTNNVTEAIEVVKAEILIKAALMDCDVIADLKPTYSDLAANGKILLHMSGTAGRQGKLLFTSEAREIIQFINKLDEKIEALKNDNSNLDLLVPKLNNSKYHTTP